MSRSTDISPLSVLLSRVDATADGIPSRDTVASGFPSIDKVLGGGLRRGDLIALMVGRELSAGYPTATQPPGAEVLRIEGLFSGPVRDASLSLRAGEIVGLVGLVGSGRTELARSVFGGARINAR